MLEVLNSYNSTENTSVSSNKAQEDQIATKHSQDAMLYAFMMLMDSINIRQHAAQTEAKILETNASDQQKLNSIAGQLNFQVISWGKCHTKQYILSSNGPEQTVWVTKKVKSNTLKAIQYTNEEVEKQRTFVGNQLMLEQQNAQVGETNLNTTINNQEQSTQISGNILSTLNTLTSKISSAFGG